jgi:outer membrane protein assembly factor BamB
MTRFVLTLTALGLFAASAAKAAPLAPRGEGAFTPLFIGVGDANSGLSVVPTSADGGLADAEGKRAFVPGAKGGIDALDLETGKVLWNSREAERPLAVVDAKLLAYRPVKDKPNAVVVVTLDVGDKGKALRESDPVVFPDWANVGLAHGRSFTTSARVEGDALWLRWQARAWYVRGADPTEEDEKAARKDADGAARVDLRTGQVEMLDADRMPPEPGPKLSAELIKAAARPVYDSFGTRNLVRTVGNLAVVIDRRKGELILSRWELGTGKPLDAVTLVDAPAFLWHFAPGGRILVHPYSLKDPLPVQYDVWRVFDLSTGKQFGEFANDHGTEITTALGPRAYYVTVAPPRKPDDESRPRTLKAVDLKTGKVVWQHPIEPRRTLRALK